MRLGKVIFFIVGFVLCATQVSFAASCPCCGRVYGNPAPGDEARVYGLRQEHEAQCCGGKGSGGAGFSAADAMAMNMMSSVVSQGAQAIGQAIAHALFAPPAPATPPADPYQRKILECEGYEYSDNFDQAVSCYEEACAMNPNDNTINYVIGRVKGSKAAKTADEYWDQRNWAKAAEYYRQACSYDDNGFYRKRMELAEKWQVEDPFKQNLQKAKESAEQAGRALEKLAADVRANKGSGQDVVLDFAGSTVDLREAKTGVSHIDRIKRNLSSGAFPECDANNLECQARTELILEALQKNKGSWQQAVNYLNREGQKGNGPTSAYQQAISYLEGFQAYEELVVDKSKARPYTRADFSSGSNESEALMDAITGESRNTWLGPKREGAKYGGGAVSDNPLNWRLSRLKSVVAAMDDNGDDAKKAIASLEQKVSANRQDEDSINALNFLRGFSGYGDFERENSK